MTDALLFLHVLSAAALFAALIAFSALVTGARLDMPALRGFVVSYRAGLLGVLAFGIALAIDLDGVEPWSAWVLIAIALWLVAGWSGERLAEAYREGGGAAVAIPTGVARLHWLSVVVVLLLLADMIWKPFA